MYVDEGEREAAASLASVRTNIQTLDHAALTKVSSLGERPAILWFARTCFTIPVLLGAGCTPFYPRVEHEAALMAPDGKSLACPTPENVSSSEPNYVCLTAARNDLEDMLMRTGFYERTLGYTAVAGGTYVALESSQKFINKSLIQHAAIGLGALVGMNQVVGADRQQDVLVAGIKALMCVELAARALQNTKTPTLTNGFVEPAVLERAVTVYGEGSRSFITRLLDAERFTNHRALSEYAKAVAEAKIDLGTKVYGAVISVRSEVRTQIALSKPDLEKIFQAQQQEVSKLIGNVVQKGQQKNSMLQHLGFLFDDESAAKPNDDKPTTDVFDQCVAPVKSGN